MVELNGDYYIMDNKFRYFLIIGLFPVIIFCYTIKFIFNKIKNKLLNKYIKSFNIGNIDSEEAAIMAKKLGGEVLYEKSTSSYSNNAPSKNTGKIIRNAPSSSSSNSSSNSNTPKKRAREELPVISKKTNSTIEKLMMSPDHKIKQNYGFFNFMRSWQKNGTEKILPYFYEYRIC